VGAGALNIAQDDTREHVVPADSDVADIAAFGAVGGTAVNADFESRRADIMAGVLVPTPNTIEVKIVCKSAWLGCC